MNTRAPPDPRTKRTANTAHLPSVCARLSRSREKAIVEVVTPIAVGDNAFGRLSSLQRPLRGGRHRGRAKTMIRASIRIGAIAMFGLASAIPGASQDMMQHVDLASPEMASAEMTRADVEAAIASATSLKPADLTGKKLSGLDLSGLDLSGAILRGARLNKTKLRDAKLDRAILDQAWLVLGRSQPSEPHTRQHFCCANATRNARWCQSLRRTHHRGSDRGTARRHRAHGRQPRR